MTREQRRANGGFMLWEPRWTMRLIRWFGLDLDRIGNKLISWGIWDAPSDMAPVYWQLKPWRNNVQKLAEEMHRRRMEVLIELWIRMVIEARNADKSTTLMNSRGDGSGTSLSYDPKKVN